MSWAQLLNIVRENRGDAARVQQDPPVAYPIDGAILVIRADGIRNCPIGNYRWPR